MDESFLRLKGRRICEKTTKKYFGRLSDILVNKDTNKIIGIVSKNESLIYRHRLFYMRDVAEWDELNVFVRGWGEKFVKVVPIFAEYKSCENDIMKKKAIFESGYEAGKIQNIKFDFEAGTMTDFEIGTSIIQDLLNGRLICPTRQNICFFPERIVLGENGKQSDLR